MVWLESPSGVGFSYGTNNNYTSTDVSTAEDNYAFLQGLMAIHPEWSTQRFYITGESFAGNYCLELAQLVAHGNDEIASQIARGLKPDQTPINLAGVAVGNPTMDWAAGANAYLPFMSYHGFISPQDLANATAICNGVFHPSPSQECTDIVNQITTQVCFTV